MREPILVCVAGGARRGGAGWSGEEAQGQASARHSFVSLPNVAGRGRGRRAAGRVAGTWGAGRRWRRQCVRQCGCESVSLLILTTPTNSNSRTFNELTDECSAAVRCGADPGGRTPRPQTGWVGRPSLPQSGQYRSRFTVVRQEDAGDAEHGCEPAAFYVMQHLRAYLPAVCGLTPRVAEGTPLVVPWVGI
ncbi:hypothetical protein E2C01_025215 [Portunus trituberculatus]|uniref:Uncharacterized protein n=1 Tax=Portunus trituberculatus TaxID=210409 RepID=A0A5B7EH95_PORTR|nr:hypothetical protein [Portunus trituberculatus]